MRTFPARGVRRFWRAANPAAIAVVLAISANATPLLYNFTNFDGPSFNGGGTTVNGINNNGVVVGFSSDNAQNPTIFTNFIRTPGGIFTAFGNPGGDPLAMANGINKAGTIVGGFSNGTAFMMVNGVPVTLGAVNGTTTFQTAFGINDNGLIVGQFTDGATGTTPGFLLQNGAYTILNPVPNAAVTNAQSINNNGKVTGFYSTDGAHQHGFFYNPAAGTFQLAPDPVVFNLFLTQFLGINDLGIVSGYYQTNDGSQHGLLYDSNTQSYTFLDDPNAAKSGFSITQITGINNAGDLSGFYVDAASGQQRGFFATPAAAAPEPGSFALSITALIALAGFGVWRKRRLTAASGLRPRRATPGI